MKAKDAQESGRSDKKKTGLWRLKAHPWAGFWMQFAGHTRLGRLATRLAGAFAPAYKGRRYLARLNSHGYFSPSASIQGRFSAGEHVFIGDRVVVYESGGGEVRLGDRVYLHQDNVIQSHDDGRVIIGADTHIQTRCFFSACVGSITIGTHVQIAPHCGFYSYNHGIAAEQLMRMQPLRTKGGIVLEDDVWLGFGVIVLDGVRIGAGAVIGAGSIVTRDVPSNAVAVGSPARVISSRGDA